MRDKEAYNAYHKVYQLNRYHRRRAEAVQKLGGTCAVCNSVEELQIDHINPSQKSFDIAKLWSASKVKFQAELAKCQLLCRKHHEDKSKQEESVKEFECCGRTFAGKPAYSGHRRWCRV